MRAFSAGRRAMALVLLPLSCAAAFEWLRKLIFDVLKRCGELIEGIVFCEFRQTHSRHFLKVRRAKNMLKILFYFSPINPKYAIFKMCWRARVCGAFTNNRSSQGQTLKDTSLFKPGAFVVMAIKNRPSASYFAISITSISP